MPVQNGGTLSSATGASVANLSSLATGVVPANEEMVAFVANHHTTAGSLAHPTFAASDGVATINFVEIPGSTIVFDSGRRRLTAYRAMHNADLTGVTFTATGNGIAQNGFMFSVAYGAGVKLGGVNGAAAIKDVFVADSGATNVTSLVVSITNAMGAKDAAVAAFFSGSATAITPAWGTELHDISSGTGERLETQYSAAQVSTGNCTAGSAPLAGIVVVLSPADDYVFATKEEQQQFSNTPVSAWTSVVMRAGKLNLIVVGDDSSATCSNITPSMPGVYFAQVANLAEGGGNSARICVWAGVVREGGVSGGVLGLQDIDGTITWAGVPGGNRNFGAQKYTVSGIDLDDVDAVLTGTGILQIATAVAADPITATLANPCRDDFSNLIAAGSNGGGSTWAPSGASSTFQSLAVSNLSAGQVGLNVAWKKAAGQSFTCDGASAMAMSLMEVAALAQVVEGDPPNVTLDSPAEGAIDNDEHVVVAFDDPDNDLVLAMVFVLFAGGGSEIVYRWSTNDGDFDDGLFDSDYAAGSEINPITNGFEADFIRTGGWPDGFSVLGVAADAEGHVTIESFDFTVADPVFDPCVNPGAAPVVTVVSPLPYNDASSGARIAPTEHLVVRVTDPDADPGDPGGLRRVVPVLIFPEALRSLGVQTVHNGDEFYPMFQGSTRTEIEGGWEYDLIFWTGRWPSRPRVLPFAWDSTGNEAA